MADSGETELNINFAKAVNARRQESGLDPIEVTESGDPGPETFDTGDDQVQPGEEVGDQPSADIGDGGDGGGETAAAAQRGSFGTGEKEVATQQKTEEQQPKTTAGTGASETADAATRGAFGTGEKGVATQQEPAPKPDPETQQAAERGALGTGEKGVATQPKTDVERAAERGAFGDREISAATETEKQTISDFREAEADTLEQTKQTGRTQPQQDQTSFAALATEIATGDIDPTITRKLTQGKGLFPKGTRTLEQPGDLETPGEVGAGTSPDALAEQIAEANPGIDREDVAVTRSEGEFQIETDLSQEDVQERVAAANPGVDPADVQITRNRQGEIEFVTGTGGGEGFLDTTEFELEQRTQKRQEFFGVGKEARSLVREVTKRGPEPKLSRKAAETLAEEVVFGLGTVPGQFAAAPPQALQVADVGVEVGANLPETVQEEGAVDVATTATGVGQKIAEETAEEAGEKPGRFAGQLVGEVVTGAALAKAVTRAPDVGREVSIRAKGGDVVDFEDVSDPPVETGGLSGFTEEAVGDPDVARAEFERRAKDQPISEDPVAFSGRSPEAVSKFGKFGEEFEAPAENPDVSGQFFAADLSKLRLPGGTGRSGIKIGVPRPKLRTSRILAEEDVDVRAAPTKGEAELDRFLSEEASKEASFVRGDPTPEQEAIAPPGSKFVESGGKFGVRIGGRRIPGTQRRVGGQIVPGRLTRRGEPDTDIDTDADPDTLTKGELDAETRRAIGETRRRIGDEPDVTPTPISRPGMNRTPTDITPTRTDIGTTTRSGTPTGTDGISISEATQSTSPTDSPIGTSDTSVPGEQTPTTTTTTTTTTSTTGSPSGGVPSPSPTTPVFVPGGFTPTPTGDLPDIDVESDKKKRKFDFGDFEKQFRSPVATPEFVATETIINLDENT